MLHFPGWDENNGWVEMEKTSRRQVTILASVSGIGISVVILTMVFIYWGDITGNLQYFGMSIVLLIICIILLLNYSKIRKGKELNATL